jgi:hypothetical protein
VGLGRLAGLPHLDDATVREEIEIAVESTIEHGFGRSHCLCHGDLGNLEVVTWLPSGWVGRTGPRGPDASPGGILAGIRESGWRRRNECRPSSSSKVLIERGNEFRAHPKRSDA